jgi:putative transcriptional regulator
MDIMHHPDDATLLSYSAGSLGEALSAVMAAHLAMCPRCRVTHARMDDIGATLFDALKPAPLATSSPIPVSDVRPPSPSAAAVGAERGDVPVPLRRFVGAELDQIPWKRIGFGVWHYPLPLSDGSKGDLRLLKVSPGQAMPEHGHGGAELTLLLRGSYRDEVGTFRTGDVADLDDEVEHRPVADLEEGCICLIASEERARFRGLVARLFQPLTGF